MNNKSNNENLEMKEEVIKKRINNKEAHIKKLSKSVLTLISIVPDPANLQDCEELYAQTLQDLADFEYEMMKNDIKLKNIQKDFNYYANSCSEIGKSAEKTAQEIEGLEKELTIITKKKNLKLKYNQLSSHVVKLRPQEDMRQSILLRKRAYEEIQSDFERRKSELDSKEKKLEFVLSSLKNFLIEEEEERG